MTLGDLRKAIAAIPIELDSSVVVCQKDSEGNGYSPLAGVDHECIYLAESSYSGEVMPDKINLTEYGYTQEEWDHIKRNNPKAVVLYPTN